MNIPDTFDHKYKKLYMYKDVVWVKNKVPKDFPKVKLLLYDLLFLSTIFPEHKERFDNIHRDFKDNNNIFINYRKDFKKWINEKISEYQDKGCCDCIITKYT
jgi:hypothetical protein